MNKDEVVEIALKTSIGRKTNLLYAMAMAMDVLVNDIDKQLYGMGAEFQREKKQAFNRFCAAIRQADIWYDKCVSDDLWRASESNAARYDNMRADANELIQFLMLYIDRSHSVEGFEKAWEMMKGLPEGGLFSKEEIDRFNFERK